MNCRISRSSLVGEPAVLTENMGLTSIIRAGVSTLLLSGFVAVDSRAVHASDPFELEWRELATGQDNEVIEATPSH